jgi:hypothetical protein
MSIFLCVSDGSCAVYLLYHFHHWQMKVENYHCKMFWLQCSVLLILHSFHSDKVLLLRYLCLIFLYVHCFCWLQIVHVEKHPIFQATSRIFVSLLCVINIFLQKPGWCKKVTSSSILIFLYVRTGALTPSIYIWFKSIFNFTFCFFPPYKMYWKLCQFVFSFS